MIGPHAVINGPTTIGADNRIFQFASIGDAPQDKKYRGEPTRLEIGDRNVFRECCTINRGTAGDKGVTRIGDDNLFMAYSHVAHDCVIGANTVFANCASLGGHVEIGDWVILGGLTAVHQFTKIGAHAFLGGGSILTRDVPPYVMVAGNPAVPHSINSEGLKRRGFTEEQIRNVRDAYRILYRSELRLAEALDAARAARRGQPGSSRVRRLHPRFHPQPGAMSVVGLPPSAAAPLRVGIVAGEASGDQLGAALIAALRARVPQLHCFGVAGPKMIAAGCEAWAPAEELAVMGLAEVLRHLPRLLSLRAELARRFCAAPPDVFVGIDAPEFNLALARRLKHAGVRTVQYVSPQVWAWRQGRVRSIGAACDLVLCLLPFETAFYARHGVPALFVGHPLADQIPLEPDRAGARRALALDAAAPLVALLPGSRVGEVARLAAPFAAAARHIDQRRPGWQFMAPMASRGRS